MNHPSIVVVDQFYRRPNEIRAMATTMEYREPNGLTGWRTRAYHPRGIKERIESTFRLRITYWEEDPDAIETSNGVFFGSYSRGSRRETPSIHYDDPADWLTLLIYLNPIAPIEAGTSVWRHRATGLTGKPRIQDARRLQSSVARLNALLERDCNDRQRWLEVARVGNVYNRAVLFTSGLLHSATSHFGSNSSNGRLYHCFSFPATW